MTSTAEAAAVPTPVAAPTEPVEADSHQVSTRKASQREGVVAEVVQLTAPTVPPDGLADRTIQSLDRQLHGAGLRKIWGSTLARAVRAQTLTAPGGLVAAVALLAPGVLIDLGTDATAGLPTTLSFLLAVALPPLLVRRRALATPAVVPPILFTGALLVLAWGSGQNATSRQVVLDAGTTLALSAPVLFAGTLLAVVLVLGRLAWGLVRRS